MGYNHLLRKLPDVPRWIEARGMLLARRGGPLGARDEEPPALVASADAGLAVVVAWDNEPRLGRALAACPPEFTVMGPAEAETALARLAPARDREGATVYVRTGPAPAAPPDGGARILADADAAILDMLPPVLRGELTRARRFTPIAACFAEDRAVSFCYAGWQTESLWDVSIDTLDGYRRRGLACAAVECLATHFAASGKQPVWGAVDSNVASRRLAERLGFTPVDRLVLCYPAGAGGANLAQVYARDRLGSAQ